MEKSSSTNRKLWAGSDVALVLSGILLVAFSVFSLFFIFTPTGKIPAALPSPMSITNPSFGQTAEEVRKFKEIEAVTQAARETAQKLAPENPPLFWQAEKVVFHTDSVWVVLKHEFKWLPQSHGLAPTVGLVIHKSHQYYADWLGFAGTAAARDDNKPTIRLFYVGLADASHPDSPEAYLSPLSDSPPPP